jgi:hypothetical protein
MRPSGRISPGEGKIREQNAPKRPHRGCEMFLPEVAEKAGGLSPMPVFQLSRLLLPHKFFLPGRVAYVLLNLHAIVIVNPESKRTWQDLKSQADRKFHPSRVCSAPGRGTPERAVPPFPRFLIFESKLSTHSPSAYPPFESSDVRGASRGGLPQAGVLCDGGNRYLPS